MTITGGSALDPKDIERMVADAERFAEEDAKRRELVDTRNQADQVVNQTETLLSEQAENLTDDERTSIEAALGELRTEVDNSEATVESLRERMDATVTASQALAQRIYQQQAEGSAAGDEPADGSDTDEDIVDAEIVDEDES
jgi:molecular chaperone DnaK